MELPELPVIELPRRYPGGPEDLPGPDVVTEANSTFDISFTGSADDKWKPYPECPWVDLVSTTSELVGQEVRHTLSFQAKQRGTFKLRLCRFDGRVYGGMRNPAVQEAVVHKVSAH